MLCTETGQTLPAGVDLEKETVITGRVVDGAGQTVGGAFVRLLDASDEFTAEVVASATGDLQFFAAPGTWTLRALSPRATVTPAWHTSGAGIQRVTSKSPERRSDDCIPPRALRKGRAARGGVRPARG